MNKTKFIALCLLFSMVLGVLSIPIEVKANGIDHTKVIDTLEAYQIFLSSKSSNGDFSLTDPIANLIVERQNFYERYFDIGLHSNLINIQSSFDLNSMVVSDTGTVEVYEFVNLTGSPKLKVAADYPIYKAALLAKQGTNDIEVSILLDAYAKEILDGVQQSIDEGEFTFTIINKHVMVFDPITWTLKTDGFTSRAKDDPGTDEVSWVDGEFIRREPEFEQMVEYEIYHTPIEVFTQELLETQTEIAKGKIGQISGGNINYTYNGSSAASYIRTWVRVNTTPCPGGSVFQDARFYNNSQYAYHDCLDCTNYASQAMYYGGLPQTAQWYPESGAWVGVNANANYLIQYGYGTYIAKTNLALGDLGVQWNTHTAMVSALNPLRYSSHTNDRLNQPWNDVLSYCIDVHVQY